MAKPFDSHQRATIAAAMARIIPTDDVPGAQEAGCIDFLENYLSGIDFILAKPDGSGFEVLEGKSAEAWLNRVHTMRTRYIDGVSDLDRRAQAKYGAQFVALSAEQQDAVLTDVGAGASGDINTAPASTEPALQQTLSEVDLAFFLLLVTHTRQGFYSDPIYGGNKNFVGWQTIGFPGPGFAEGGPHRPLHNAALFRGR